MVCLTQLWVLGRQQEAKQTKIPIPMELPFKQRLQETKLEFRNKWNKASHPQPNGEGQHPDGPPLPVLPSILSQSLQRYPHQVPSWKEDGEQES